MKWLIDMKPNARGWFVLVGGMFVLYLHWVEVMHTHTPNFSTSFTTPWFIVIGLMFLIYPQIQDRQPNEGWLANSKRHWKANVVFSIACIVVGLLHYQLQKHIFG
jgi:hypothetical protein